VKKDKEGKVVYDTGWRGWESGEGPLILRCLDRRNGKELWNFVFQEAELNPKRAGPYTSPVADGDRVYALGPARELVCLDAADGKVVWRQIGSYLLGEATHGYHAGDRLVVAGDLLLFSGQAKSCTRITALDKAKGTLRWSKHFKPPHWRITYTTPATLTTPARQCFLLVGAHVLVCIDPDSGAIWQSKELDWEPNKEGDFYHTRNYLVSGTRFYVQRKKTWEAFEAVAAAGGTGLACKQLWTCEERPGGMAIPSEGLLLIVAPGGDRRRVLARDAATGKLLWDKRVEKGDFSGGIAVGGKLILTSGLGELVLAQPGEADLKILSRAQLAGCEALGSSPAWSKGHLFVRDRAGLVKCLDLKTP
jgi:outer membrane protein assembly factor BamB